MIERIVAAAIQESSGTVYSLPPPARHHTLINARSSVAGEQLIVQGFVTSTGRFVDRVEGAAIAIASGQIEKLQWPPRLYSEDLW